MTDIVCAVNDCAERFANIDAWTVHDTDAHPEQSEPPHPSMRTEGTQVIERPIRLDSQGGLLGIFGMTGQPARIDDRPRHTIFRIGRVDTDEDGCTHISGWGVEPGPDTRDWALDELRAIARNPQLLARWQPGPIRKR